MKKIKILFQGDSITDAGRDKRNYHNMGQGYPKYASEHIAAAFPETEFEFINFGISGNRTGQLFDRIYTDGIAFQPDIISILIGVNDVWHRYGGAKIMTSDEQVELNLRMTLKYIRENTNAKVILLLPYILDYESEERNKMRSDIVPVQKIVYKLADEFADVCVPLDKLFAEAVANQPEPLYYSRDGVHPNENGARFIGENYARYASPLIEELINK